MERFSGKVVFISGGAKGQGAEEARMFGSENAKVVITDILDEPGTLLQKKLTSIGIDCLYLHLDVTKESEWEKAYAETLSKFSKVDILVNNAGIVSRNSITETSLEEWENVLKINATGSFLGTKLAVPIMQEIGGGSIINISSTGGLVSSPTLGAAYASSKAAIHLLTKTTALQYAKDNIRCNSVHPGPIATDMLDEITSNPEMLELYEQKIPLGRLGKPEEVAHAVLFLASEEASFITGTELIIDGGMLAQ